MYKIAIIGKDGKEREYNVDSNTIDLLRARKIDFYFIIF